MKTIEYRFWNTDLPKPIMEYGSTDDLAFVEKSIGKEKMLFVIEHKGQKYYEKDIVAYSDRNEKDNIYFFYDLKDCFLTNMIGYQLQGYDLKGNEEASCKLLGNLLENPIKYIES